MHAQHFQDLSACVSELVCGRRQRGHGWASSLVVQERVPVAQPRTHQVLCIFGGCSHFRFLQSTGRYTPFPWCSTHIRCPTAKQAGNKPRQRAQGCALEGKLALTHVPRVCLAQHSVTVAWHHFTRLERVPHELFELLLAGVFAKLRLDVLEPAQHLLVGEAMKGAGEAVEAGSEGEVRVGEGAANKVDSVR